MIIQGKVRRVSDYSDGTPRLEIHFHKKNEADLPIIKNEACQIQFEVEGEIYKSKIHHTDNNDVIWISPKCDKDGEKIRLADILINAGFENTDNISVNIQAIATVMPKSSQQD